MYQNSAGIEGKYYLSRILKMFLLLGGTDLGNVSFFFGGGVNGRSDNSQSLNT